MDMVVDISDEKRGHAGKSRCFYPKRLTLHSSYSFYILSALAFPGNRTHDLGIASAMLYHLSYRKAITSYRFGSSFRPAEAKYIVGNLQKNNKTLTMAS